MFPSVNCRWSTRKRVIVGLIIALVWILIIVAIILAVVLTRSGKYFISAVLHTKDLVLNSDRGTSHTIIRALKLLQIEETIEGF